MTLKFELGPGRMIGGSNPCFIIAEIGQNHQGDIEIAKKMIKMAKDCGADCAKFQKSELEYKFNKRALERPYTSKHSWGKTYGDHKRHLEFSHEQYRELQKYAKEVGIFFAASGMDEMAVEFLDELDVPFFKVASCDANNFPYLELTARKGRPMVISSGMQSMATMRRVYQTVKEHNRNFTILQCTSAYPLDPEDVNLRVIALGKSVVAKVAIPKGTVLSMDMLGVKVGEPRGVSPEDMGQLVGKAVTEDVEEDGSITPRMVDVYNNKG
ncbi:unnamed protein product [Oncorhynchus mykiss]|uniref:Ice-structuring protein n=1 Tax=Oncorhynchus mykiss TaxID=8022 RepID=A0A060VSB7_ONCMY|nr:unnamed protein product [Oncorhynchus mykiss]